MASTPKDGVRPDSPLWRVGTSGSNLFRSVRNRLHVGKRSPNPFDGPSTDDTLVESPNPYREPGSTTPEKGKSKAVAESVENENQLQRNPKASSNNEAVEFSQSKAVFALDVSGSTAGKVLRVEKGAITTLTHGLSAARKRDTQILPWDSRAHEILRLDELDYVDSSGATNPTVLLSNLACKTSLIGSDLWFLLTDGEIDEDLVRSLALEIGAARLHGTACVIIVFASSLERPILCNISVGKSIFAVAPDCLFLFHDFETEEIYVLQSKGCFRALLPEGKQRLNIDLSTRWEDLHKISYSELHDLRIPLPRKPDQDTVVLTGGQLLDLNDIYNNTLDESMTQELLARYEDLDTLILTAHTRGRADDVRQWISKQRIQTRDPLWIERPDEQELGASLTRALVERLRVVPRTSAVGSLEPSNRSGDESSVETLRESLRACHERNWELFSSVLGIDTKRRRQRDRAIRACISGLEECRSEPSSPAVLSPASSGIPPKPTSDVTGPKPEREVVGRDNHSPDLLFLKGYEAMRKWEPSHGQRASENCYGTCGLCGETDVILCLLLKMPPVETQTEGFPSVGSKSKHKFPLVLGNYPETDVVASLVCCDACSHFIVQYGETPEKEMLITALPLVSFQSDVNKKNWKQILSEAFQHRFHDEVLVLVLISSICNTIDDVSAADSMRADATVSALKRAAHHLSNAPNTLSTISPASTPIVGIDPSKPLNLALSRTLTSLDTDDCPLLFYPLDGFVVLVHVGSLLESGLAEMQSFVWLRTLYHFTEKHYALQTASGDKEAAQALLSALSGSSDWENNGDDVSRNGEQGRARKFSISVAQLDGTYLFPMESGELATLQRLGDYFLKVQSSCASALAVFLYALLVNTTKFASPKLFFYAMKSRNSLQNVFWKPENTSEENARDMIRTVDEHLLSLSTD